MLAIREGAKPDDAAKAWIAKNPDRVAEWLK
jgi:glycine betaine/proline transport system substrate-binding protein